MLKIRRSFDKVPTFALSGRIDHKHLSELQAVLEAEREAGEISLDLDEVKLVDRESIRFLASCEARGIGLKNCPFYVREWIKTRIGKTHELQPNE
jgi:ABC-type transporter Mla MlaB component